ncbi:putative multidrug resistance-associated protein 4 isoform X2 [Apostichopus japonicus]|uniref:Putative multidrug resistance-associated protein 4 isoform X2 n=1 Tax=Stichopus japonicus TaxID=307972 RepID=A0A2G8LNC8_STIJA|nr:putative multidrug resistance-associated protein 4 isoform X2 [Apostichopus japonicus]
MLLSKELSRYVYIDPTASINLRRSLIGLSKPQADRRNETPAITSSNLSVEWSHQCDDKAFSLKGISFSVSPGEVVAVIGPVGAGKSMLLMGLLGELPVTHGHYNVSKKIGYASQQPWVFSGTIRENILFGREYEEKRFRKVLEQCDLNQDLSQYADKDLTLVGEKGVKLSGGQRSRVGLARVLYSDTNVYLLDDPLSAVDSRVGRHLFERCISGSSKAILLVTHQLQYLKAVDRILIIKEGEMSGYGTYQELQDAGIDFGSLLSETSEDDDFQEEITSEKLIQNDEKRPEEKSIHQENEVTKQDKAGQSWQPNKDSSKSDTLCDSKGIKKLTENEENFEKKEEGSVRQGVYREYIMAGATPLVLIFFLVIDMSAQSFDILSNWWLATWTKKEESCVLQYSQETCLSNVTMIEDYALFTPTMGRSYFYLIYAIFVTSLLLLIFITVRWLFFILIKASTNLHSQMFEAVIRSPQQFFIINPVGKSSITYFLTLNNSCLLQANKPEDILFRSQQPGLLSSLVDHIWSGDSQGVQNSKVHVPSVLCSSKSEHIYRVPSHFTREVALDQHGGNTVHLVCCSCVYGSILVNMYFTIDGAKLGVSLAYLIGLAGEFAYSVRLTAELENLMVATERVVEYTKLEPEAPLETDTVPSKDWPQNGGIIFKNVSLRYTSNGQLALKKLNAAIQPKEKIGIVGRTGAGTLTPILERTSPLYHRYPNPNPDLNKNISFIPQDPLLFQGTLRDNLDPFNEHSDEQLWTSLKEVQLQSKVQQEAEQLEMKIAEVEETTALAKSNWTDQLIQATIRHKFRDCTILTIAHRLSSIMDSDRVLVLEAGEIVEFDKPSKLLEDVNGHFTMFAGEADMDEKE